MQYYLFLTHPISPFFLRRRKFTFPFSGSDPLTVWYLSPKRKHLGRMLEKIDVPSTCFISSDCHLWPQIQKISLDQEIPVLDGSILSPFIAYQLSISHQKTSGVPLCNTILNLQGSPLFLYRYLILAHSMVEHVCIIGDDSLLPLCEQIYMEYGLPVVLRAKPKEGIILTESCRSYKNFPTIALSEMKFRGSLPMDPAIPLTLPVVEAYCHALCPDCLPIYKTLPLHPYITKL